MTMKHIAIIGVVAVAALAYAPSAIHANAHGGGFKMHSGHFGKHFRHGRHKNFNQWWPYAGYGGLYAIPPYDNVNYVEFGADRIRVTTASCSHLPDQQRGEHRSLRERRDSRHYNHALLTRPGATRIDWRGLFDCPITL